jgi:hypothetical protein
MMSAPPTTEREVAWLRFVNGTVFEEMRECRCFIEITRRLITFLVSIELHRGSEF